jgi:hypothetical protein
MEGLLQERNALRDRRRSFEGYVWFQRAPQDGSGGAAPAVTPA